jgi:hypothetical protein
MPRIAAAARTLRARAARARGAKFKISKVLKKKTGRR